MASLADSLLSAAGASAISAVHGEPVTILTGPDAGRTFTAVIEVEADAVQATELGLDPRPRRVARFLLDSAPTLGSQDTLRTADGRTYKAVRQPGASFLTTDYELIEITARDA